MLNRRDFLTAFKKPLDNKKKVENILRPPYASSESLFLSECINCESKDCKTHCEEEIIVIKADGTPTLNFHKSGCTFCQECAKVCKYGVLSLDNSQKINAIFEINFKSCLAHNNTICFSCKEPCLDDAILFNGMFNPIIDNDKCTSCGFCLSRCPTNAIEYKIVKIEIGEESGE